MMYLNRVERLGSLGVGKGKVFASLNPRGFFKGSLTILNT